MKSKNGESNFFVPTFCIIRAAIVLTTCLVGLAILPINTPFKAKARAESASGYKLVKAKSAQLPDDTATNVAKVGSYYLRINGSKLYVSKKKNKKGKLLFSEVITAASNGKTIFFTSTESSKKWSPNSVYKSTMKGKIISETKGVTDEVDGGYMEMVGVCKNRILLNEIGDDFRSTITYNVNNNKHRYLDYIDIFFRFNKNICLGQKFMDAGPGMPGFIYRPNTGKIICFSDSIVEQSETVRSDCGGAKVIGDRIYYVEIDLADDDTWLYKIRSCNLKGKDKVTYGSIKRKDVDLHVVNITEKAITYKIGKKKGVFKIQEALVKKLYKKKISSLKNKSSYVSYKFTDIDGDGMQEMMIENHPGDKGSARHFQIYTCKKGKLVRTLSIMEYGLDCVTIYKKAKSMVVYYVGHGHVSYEYFKKKSGKYKLIASRGRMAIAGGNPTNGQWYYYSKSGEIKKKAFSKLIKGMQSGEKKSYPVSKWKTVYPDTTV